MDGSSVTRAPASPTRAIVADEAFCRQAAALLLCEEGLEMVSWALKHEQDEGFDAARALPSWARRRGRGAWRADRRDGGHPDGDRRA